MGQGQKEAATMIRGETIIWGQRRRFWIVWLSKMEAKKGKSGAVVKISEGKHQKKEKMTMAKRQCWDKSKMA